MAPATNEAIDAVWRIESARLIAGLTRIAGDISVAEDLAQDALVAACEQWPRSGVPDNPGAWLMAVARRRGIDSLRRKESLGRGVEELGRDLELRQRLQAREPIASIDRIADDTLRLVFMTCHPVLGRDARVALTLRLVAGLTTPEIASAFLVSEGTIAQRIVRAKRTLKEAEVPFEAPTAGELQPRLAAVLDVVYLIFNEGYSASSGPTWTRPKLCEEALRLARMLAALLDREPEVHGLLALLELQASRLRSRSGPDGSIVRLDDQDRSRWDRLLISRGLAALERARELGGAAGPFALQAGIAACHAEATSVAETNWPRIVALYDALAALTGSPVVELNRAVAVSKAFGAAAGLELVDGLRSDPALRSYHHLPSVRGDLLVQLGRETEATAEFRRAAELCENGRERELLLARAAGEGEAQDRDASSASDSPSS